MANSIKVRLAPQSHLTPKTVILPILVSGTDRNPSVHARTLSINVLLRLHTSHPKAVKPKMLLHLFRICSSSICLSNSLITSLLNYCSFLLLFIFLIPVFMAIQFTFYISLRVIFLRLKSDHVTPLFWSLNDPSITNNNYFIMVTMY